MTEVVTSYLSLPAIHGKRITGGMMMRWRQNMRELSISIAKPGYDPVELHVDMATKSIPLDASLVKGSHGAVVANPDQQGIVLSTNPAALPTEQVDDVEIFSVMCKLANVI